MLNDLAVLKAEQVERDRRSGVTSDAFIFGMQQYKISVHKRAIDCYIGGSRTRYFRGKRLHSSKTIGKVRVMLYEGLAKIPIDYCRIFLTKDIDHGLAGVGAQSVGGRHSSALRLSRRCIRQDSNTARNNCQQHEAPLSSEVPVCKQTS